MLKRVCELLYKFVHSNAILIVILYKTHHTIQNSPLIVQMTVIIQLSPLLKDKNRQQLYYILTACSCIEPTVIIGKTGSDELDCH